MATGMNKVFLLGNIGKDPDLRQIGDNAKLSFSLATSEKWRDRDTGEPREKTEWHNVGIWGKRAEALAKILAKGDRIMVEGKIQHSDYEGRDGSKKYWSEVRARDVYLAGRRPTHSSGAGFDLTGTGGFDDGRKMKPLGQVEL